MDVLLSVEDDKAFFVVFKGEISRFWGNLSKTT
jgi:hypothetical protein